MTEIQVITKDWEGTIKMYAETMAGYFTHLTSVGPSHPEFNVRFDSYETLCRDFVKHVTDFYGSPQGFSDFVRGDLRQKFSSARLAQDEIDEYPNWIFERSMDELQTAEQLSRLYRINYLESIDSIAHYKAFHHATPANVEFKP